MARVKVHAICRLPADECLCDELAWPSAPVVLNAEDLSDDAADRPEPFSLPFVSPPETPGHD